MTKEEMIGVLIDKYADLIRIKRAEKPGNTENEELEYQLKVTKAKLEAYGVVTETLEFK